MTDGWTLDELVRRAGEMLAAGDVRAPNGRVTPLPDRRVVRWYSTIGLVDRPLAYRGRTALYGPRHLLQVVAVKRRQAEGRSLADIQAELTGATNTTLQAVARLPLSVHEGAPLPPVAPPPTEAAHVPKAPPAPPRPGGPPTPGATERLRFWTAAPADAEAAHVDQGVPVGNTGVSRQKLLDHAPDQAEVWAAVSLGVGATLMLRAWPEGEDLAAIRAAARPLLDLLAQRGLLASGQPGGEPGRQEGD